MRKLGVVNTLDRIINTLDRIVNTLDRIINTLDRIINTLDRIVNTLVLTQKSHPYDSKVVFFHRLSRIIMAQKT